jgi:S1-C subfamily serine protease
MAQGAGADLSNTLASMVEATANSIVRVEARAHRGSSGVVYAADGVVLTAHHAVEREEGVHVALADGSSHEAQLVGRDPGTDLAVLRIDAKDLAPAKWGDFASLKVGHLAVTLARPGRTIRASLGIIGALGDEIRTPAGGKLERYVQTDITPQHGFSGGLVVDLDGRALGLNTSGLFRDVNVAIPPSTVKRVVDELLAHGEIRRGYLGVGVYPVRLGSAAEQKLNGQRFGLILVALEPGSPAEKAGLFMGDVLVALDGQALVRPFDLSALLEERVGKSVSAKVLRSGAFVDVTVTPGQRG